MSEQDAILEDKTDAQGRRATDSWHVIRGIPVAVLLALGGQTIAVVWFFAGLSSNVALQGAQIAKLDAKLDALTQVVQSTTAPTAVAERRIAELERQMTQTTSKVYENDRRISTVEVRLRAGRER